MAIEKFEKNMAIVSGLDDEPNDVGGLSAAELKAKFDEGGEALKAYINNTLIPGIVREVSAASVASILDGSIPQKKLEEAVSLAIDRAKADGEIDKNLAAAVAALTESLAKKADESDVLPVLTSSKTLYVSPDGNDSTGDGSSGKPYLTIQKAIDTLPKNLGGYTVTINVAAGEYSSIVTLKGFSNGTIRIWGAGASTTTISITSGTGIAVDTCSADIDLRNFTIDCNNTSATCIYAINAYTAYIASTVFKNTKAYAFCFVNFAFATVNGCTFTNCTGTYGAVLAAGGLACVSNCTGSDNSIGVCSGSNNSAKSAIVTLNNCSIGATTQYSKQYGGVIFNGGVLV